MLAEAWQMLLRPIPSLHCLFEELAGKVERLLECEVALALENVDRVVGDGFRFGLEGVNNQMLISIVGYAYLLFAVGEDIIVPSQSLVIVHRNMPKEVKNLQESNNGCCILRFLDHGV